MELFEPILHFFEQRWVHNIIWAVILAIGTAVAAKVVSQTLNHLPGAPCSTATTTRFRHRVSSSTSRAPSSG